MKAKMLTKKSDRIIQGKLAKALSKKQKATKTVKQLDEKGLAKQRTAELSQMPLADLEKLHLKNALATEPVAAAMARSREAFASKQISDLKQICEKKNVKISGTKGELIERLLEIEKDELKTEMVKALVAFEAKARAETLANELKIREIVKQMKKDTASKTNEELKDLCMRKGLKPGASKKDRVERIVSRAREDGEVEKVLAAKAREARQGELLAMDEEALMELCHKRGVNPLVKAIMVDRLLLSESVA